MTSSKILRRLVDAAPDVIDAVAKPGPRCVLSTAIGLATLDALNVDAAPYVAGVRVCNDAWLQWANDGFPDGEPGRVARGAYLLTNDPEKAGAPSLPSLNPPAGRAWNGHLVIRAGAMLVDLDAGALARPTHGIYLPRAFVVPLRDDGTFAGTCRHRGHVAHVSYRPYAAPDVDAYRTAGDWRRDYADVARTLARAIRRGVPARVVFSEK